MIDRTNGENLNFVGDGHNFADHHYHLCGWLDKHGLSISLAGAPLHRGLLDDLYHHFHKFEDLLGVDIKIRNTVSVGLILLGNMFVGFILNQRCPALMVGTLRSKLSLLG